MRVKLTQKFLLAAPPGVYFDTDRHAPPRFGAYITKGQHRAWFLDFQDGAGRQRRVTIGSVAAWPYGEARAKAGELRRYIDEGGNPLDDRKAAREAETVGDLWARYSEEVLPTKAPVTQRDYSILWAKYLSPALGGIKVEAVSRRDIEKIFRDACAVVSGARANRVMAVMSIVFNRAVEWGLRSDNPVKFIKRNTEHNRERYLSGAELSRLLAMLKQHRAERTDSADKIMLALLTGARRGEILGIEWSDILDLDTPHPVWVRPAWKTKQRRTSRVPLSTEVASILRRRRDAEVRPLREVFRYGNTKAGIYELERDWCFICKEADIAGFRFHDLRHSFASLLVSEGLSLPIIGQLLGHARPATTARYAHLADQPLRDAAELLAGRVKR
jgi:integrase